MKRTGECLEDRQWGTSTVGGLPHGLGGLSLHSALVNRGLITPVDSLYSVSERGRGEGLRQRQTDRQTDKGLITPVDSLYSVSERGGVGDWDRDRQTDKGLITPVDSLYSVSEIVCLFVGCLMPQQHVSVSQGRICTDNFTCCHTEIEVADKTFHLTQSQYTDTGPTSPSADPIMPGAWQGSHWSANV